MAGSDGTQTQSDTPTTGGRLFGSTDSSGGSSSTPSTGSGRLFGAGTDTSTTPSGGGFFDSLNNFLTNAAPSVEKFTQGVGSAITGAVGNAVSSTWDTYQQTPQKIKDDIQSGAQDIQKSYNAPNKTDGFIDFAKGILKAGGRTAGDFAQAVFAPLSGAVGSILGGTGAQGLEDSFGQKIADASGITNWPAFQRFAMTHPNAGEDFNRILNLGLSSESDPKEVVKQTENLAQKLVDHGNTTTQEEPTPTEPTATPAAPEPTVENIQKTIEQIKSQPAPEETATAAKPESNIIVGRHGDINAVEDNIAHGQVESADTKLNPEGRQQAVKLGQDFEKQGIDHIVSSDLSRGKSTADIAASVSGADTSTNPLLRTKDIGILDGKPLDETVSVDGKDMTVKDALQYYRDNPEAKPEGGESQKEFDARVNKGIAEEQAKYPGKKVGFVLHNEILKSLGHEMEPGEVKSIETAKEEPQTKGRLSTEKGRGQAVNKPVESTGEKVKSQSVTIDRITKNLDAATKSGFEEDTSHNVMNKAEQAKKAWDFVNGNVDKAEGILFDGKNPPEGLTKQAVSTAYLEKTLNDYKDGKATIEDVLKAQQADELLGSRAGQELGLRANRYDKDSPAYWLEKAQESVGKSDIKYKTEKATRTRAEGNKIARALEKTKLKIDEASKIIDMLTC